MKGCMVLAVFEQEEKSHTCNWGIS